MVTKYAEAQTRLKELKKKIKDDPKDYTAIFKYGVYLHSLGKSGEAAKYFQDLAKLGAKQREVYYYGAEALNVAGRYAEAEAIARTGLQKFPDDIDLNHKLVIALHEQHKNEEADKILKAIVNSSHQDEASMLSMGVFYMNVGSPDKALEVFKAAHEQYPDNINILTQLGTAYSAVGDDVSAPECFVKALRMEPKNVKSLVNAGLCFQKLKNLDVAVQFFDEALKLDADNPHALCAKSTILSLCGLAQEMIDVARKGLAIFKENSQRKDREYLKHYSNLIFYMHYIPNQNREEIFAEIQEWQRELCGHIEEKSSVSFPNKPDKNRKLRIGFLSGGFHVHPVGQMIFAGLEHLDKENFELYLYTETEEKRKDYLYDKFLEIADVTLDIRHKPNHEVLSLIRDDNIDILVEMVGHSEGGIRLPLIAERVAPVQVKWVGGLFNTTGIPQMDWIIGDSIEIPEGEEKWYTEKVYRMPDDYIVYYPPYYANEVGPLPALENGYVTFGNLNNVAKTNSYSIELWSKILHAVPNSKMLLKGNKMDTAFVQDHLYKSFEAHGIHKDRVIIEGGELHKKFLDVYNKIDIALDPHPYTGGLTTCEALWMGVPVVTLPGDTFAGRHAATHLTNAHMPEWIAKDEQDYIDIAVQWANDFDKLSTLRSGLREHVSQTPLVDGPSFAQNLGAGLRYMWNEWCDEKEAANKPKVISRPKPKKSKKNK